MHNRECGSQPAHQGLITDFLRFRSTQHDRFYERP
ncbi:hypothetical protein ACVIHF_008785 [Bradyrhizobium sp. USDA 4506]